MVFIFLFKSIFEIMEKDNLFPYSKEYPIIMLYLII